MVAQERDCSTKSFEREHSTEIGIDDMHEMKGSERVASIWDSSKWLSGAAICQEKMWQKPTNS